MASEGTQVITTTQTGADRRLLSQEGFVSAPAYGFTTPGGCGQLQCTLAAPASRRSPALDPGRLCYGVRGGSIAWTGVLEEPQLGDAGWAITATGAGAEGNHYRAIYSGAWGTGAFNDAVDQAIGRGLNWIRGTDIGAVSGLWTGQRVDSGAQTITDLLNLGCHKGGLTWQVRTTPRGNILTVFPWPIIRNRLLIGGDPVPRAVGDAPTTLYTRYQSTADSGTTPAAYGLTSVTDTDMEAVLGRREDLMDISSAGVYTAGAAQAVANRAMNRYQRVAFGDSFTVSPGELLNVGGQPVDLGLFWQDGITSMMCQLYLADYPYGGEIAGGPLSIMIGSYTYNADGTATLTPLESQLHDWSSVMGVAVDTTPVRVQPNSKATTRPMIRA